MAFPDRDIPADELFLKMLERPAPSEIVEFPRKGVGNVRVFVLPLEVHTQARLAGKRRFQDQLKKGGQASALGQTADAGLEAEVLADLVACEVIALAYYTEKPFAETEHGPQYKRLFASGADVEKLSADEVAILFAYYTATKRKYGPNEASFESDDEVNAWIKRLEDGGSGFPLYQLESHQQVDLIQRLALRAQALSLVIHSLRENLPINLESLPAAWSMDTGLSGEHASGYTPTIPSDPITLEAARELVKALRAPTNES